MPISRSCIWWARGLNSLVANVLTIGGVVRVAL